MRHVNPVQPVPFEAPPFVMKEFEPVEEHTKHDGRIVKTMKLRVVDPSKRFEGLSVDDFSLESVAAAGGLDSLQLVKANIGSPFGLDASVSRLDSSIPVVEPSNNLEK